MVQKPLWVLLFTALLSISVIAQDACPSIVESALEAIDDFCTEAGRNQACYGNVSLEAEAKEGVSSFKFEETGDIVDVVDIASLRLQPMNEAENTWGVALMRLQANLPDTAPGQNVTFLLFGDVEISPNDSIETETPMQAFYLKTGIGDAPCAEAPASGLIVQTPEGAQEVAFNVNGVEVSMGSTILFRAKPGEEMTVSALEGSAVMNFDGDLFPIIAGTWARMPMNESLQVLNTPELPVAYKKEVLSALPVRVLARPIEVRPPLDETELERLHDTLKQGLPPCGDAEGLFPPCEKLPFFNRDGASLPNTTLEGTAVPLPPFNWANESRWGQERPNLPPLGTSAPFVLRLENGSECIILMEGVQPAPEETRPLCSTLLSDEEIKKRIERLGASPIGGVLPIGTPPAGDILPPRDVSAPSVDTRTCVFEPRPGDPPLPASETRPFCPTPTPPVAPDSPPPDTRTCITRPGPDSPPLPASETRPFCTDPVPPAPDSPPPASGRGDDDDGDDDGDDD